MEERSGTCSVQRGSREAIAVEGVGEGCGGWRSMLLLSGVGSVVCSRLEPEQVLTSLCPVHDCLALGSDWMFEMENEQLVY